MGTLDANFVYAEARGEHTSLSRDDDGGGSAPTSSTFKKFMSSFSIKYLVVASHTMVWYVYVCECVCGKHTHTKRHDVIACSNKNNNHLRKYSNLQCCVRYARNGRKLLTNKEMVHVRMSFFRYARAGKSVCVWYMYM